MAAEKAGLTEEEVITLALNDMFQFFYPHAERGWQAVPGDKVWQVYAAQSSALMEPEAGRDSDPGWSKEMFFIRKEDLDTIIAQNPYGDIKRHAENQHADRARHPRLKKIFKTVGGIAQLFSPKGERESMPVTEEAGVVSDHGEHFDDNFGNNQNPPPSPKNIKKRLWRHRPLLWMVDPEQYSGIAAVFRTLANKIAFISDTKKMKVFLMTGSDDKAGTSTVLFNTALMMGRSMLDRRILLVDTNIDRPSLHIAFEHSPAVCLMDYLLAGAELNDIIQPTFLPNVDIITCNRIDDPMLSPFTRPIFSQFFQEIRERYEIILLDSAPVLRSSHTRLLLPKSDGVIIVVEANETRLRNLEKLVRHLYTEGATLLGSFLNKRRYVIPGWLYRIL